MKGPAIVLAGAPSLPDEWASIPEALRASAALFSANDHGARFLAALGKEPDWVVCGDKHHQVTKELMLDKVRKVTDAPVVTQHFAEGTTRFHNWDSFGLKANSGYMAMLWAWLNGHCPIILCGFGLYQDGVYWDDPESLSSGSSRLLEEHLGKFRQYWFQMLPWTIRSMGGPLCRVTGRFREGEPGLSGRALTPLGSGPTDSPVSVPYPSHKHQAYWSQVFDWYECTAEHPLAKVGGSQLELGKRYYLTHIEGKAGLRGNFLRKLDPLETV